LEAEFRSILIGHAPLTAYIPAPAIVFGDVAQGTVKPFISMMVVSTSKDLTMDGAGSLCEDRIQVDVVTNSITDTRAISRIVSNLLHGYRGGVFKGIFLGTSRDAREGSAGEVERPYRSSIDFFVHWRNS
jgi:hypothetical protein